MDFTLRLQQMRSTFGIIFRIAVLLIMACQTYGCAGQMRKYSSLAEEYAKVRFSFVDRRAESVCVAGDFNNWSKDSHCMEREGERWTIALALAPGRYQYLFIIDNKDWRRDPAAFLTQANGFGGENCVLIVD